MSNWENTANEKTSKKTVRILRFYYLKTTQLIRDTDQKTRFYMKKATPHFCQEKRKQYTRRNEKTIVLKF